jgi:hypothetical protein
MILGSKVWPITLRLEAELRQGVWPLLPKVRVNGHLGGPARAQGAGAA